MPISSLAGIGPKRAEQFQKLGVNSVGELITFYPRAYEDWSNVEKIANITESGTYCVKAVLASPISDSRIAGGRILSKGSVYDDTGSIQIVFFNNRYISSMLTYGIEYFFYGKINCDNYGMQMVSPIEKMPGSNTLMISPAYASSTMERSCA